MEKSAGLIIIYNKKMLLVHPTGASWKNSYSIPKGKIEKGEKIVEAAIRETMEETGVIIRIDQIKGDGPTINYSKEGGKVYKRLHSFIVEIDSLDQINLKGEVIDKKMLPPREVDWAGFVDLHDIENKIFWRFKEFINLI